MSGDIIGLGLIGTGRWGLNYIKTLSILEGIELRWLASSNPQSQKLVGPRCRITDDWRQLVNAPNLDGVIVATPPSSHAEIVEYAVKHGLGVLVEKPLTLCEHEASFLLELARQEHVFVLVDHTHLFNPPYRKLKEFASVYGPILGISSIGGNWGPFRKDTPVLWDWGSHDVAMCLDLLGYALVMVKAERLETNKTAEGLGEILSLQLTFENNVHADIIIGNIIASKKRRLEVYLQDRKMVYDDMAENKLIINPLSSEKHGSSEAIGVDATPPLTCAVKEFGEALRKGETSLESLELGMEVVRTLSRLEAILNSRSC